MQTLKMVSVATFKTDKQKNSQALFIQQVLCIWTQSNPLGNVGFHRKLTGSEQ